MLFKRLLHDATYSLSNLLITDQ